MSKKDELLHDMADLIRKHNIADIDPEVTDILARVVDVAEVRMGEIETVRFIESTDNHIEQIRQANTHQMTG